MSWIVGTILIVAGAIPFYLVWDASKDKKQVPFGPKWLVLSGISLILGLGVLFLDNDFILGIILFLIAIGAGIWTIRIAIGWMFKQEHPGYLKSWGMFLIAFFGLSGAVVGIGNGISSGLSSSSDSSNSSEVVEDNNDSSESDSSESSNTDTSSTDSSSDSSNDGKVYDKYTKQYETKEDQKAIDSTIKEANQAEYSNIDKLNNAFKDVPNQTNGAFQYVTYNKDRHMTIAYVNDAVNMMVSQNQEETLKAAYTALDNIVFRNSPYPDQENPKYIVIKNSNNDTIARTGLTGKFKYIGS